MEAPLGAADILREGGESYGEQNWSHVEAVMFVSSEICIRVRVKWF